MVQKKAQDLTSEGRADIPAHPLCRWLLGWIPLLVHPALCSRAWPLRTTSPGLSHCLSSGWVWPKGITGKRLEWRTRFLPLLTDMSSSSSSAHDTCSPISQTLHSLLTGIQKHWVLPLPWGPSFSELLIPGSHSTALPSFNPIYASGESSFLETTWNNSVSCWDSTHSEN